MSDSSQTPEYTPTQYTTTQIANFFLIMSRKDNITDLTCLKLVKLVYFAYAWYLVLFNEEEKADNNEEEKIDNRLFAEPPIKGSKGPIIASIYNEFKRYGNHPISNDILSSNEDPENNNDLKAELIPATEDNYLIIGMLSLIWKKYKNKSGADLSEITHEDGSAWHVAKNMFDIIPDDKIKERARQAIEELKEEILPSKDTIKHEH